MKILLAATEAVPFCKTGGLADVVGALSQKLGVAGHDVCLFLPKYRAVQSAALPGGLTQSLSVPLGASAVPVSLRYMQYKSVSVYFVDCPPLFDRDGLYVADDGHDHPDNDLRFSVFCRAVLEGAKAVGFKPDVVHLHDWQTGLVPAYLKRHYKDDPFFASTSTVFTIHNIAYQGNFPGDSAAKAGFGPEDLTSDKFEYYGQFSFLKAGLVSADLLSTVSPTYAGEIQASSERGFGMEGLLQRRSADLAGILNGIDLEVWNPEKDPYLPVRYGAANSAEGKAACRKSLLADCGLDGTKDLPLVGIVSRLDRQKGLDLAIAALEPRLDFCRVAVLGSGDPSLRAAFQDLARRRPDAVVFREGFDDPFAHQLYAASDLFLMPSRFEPCGLGQMIAMRYGSVPVVAQTGGLADTISEPGNGFLCRPDDAQDLGRALDRALTARAGAGWGALRAAAMACDLSWEKSVQRYVELYRRAQAGRA